MPEQIEIEVCERLMDHTHDGKPKFHAQIKGQPGYWETGPSVSSAIGNLIRTHADQFEIKVTYLDKPLAR